MINVKLFFENDETKTIIVDDSTFRDDEYFNDLSDYLYDNCTDDYVYYEVMPYDDGDTLRKKRIRSLIDAQIEVFKTQQVIKDALEEVGVQIWARNLELQLFQCIDKVADAIGVQPTVVPFDAERFPNTMEHYIMYKGFKLFQLEDVKR